MRGGLHAQIVAWFNHCKLHLPFRKQSRVRIHGRKLHIQYSHHMLFPANEGVGASSIAAALNGAWVTVVDVFAGGTLPKNLEAFYNPIPEP